MRNNAHKILERNGIDYDLAEDLKGYGGSDSKVCQVRTDPEELSGFHGDHK